MATSTAEFRQIIAEYNSITAASRASDNTNGDLLPKIAQLQERLVPYVNEGFDAGGYNTAANINNDLTSYSNLIQQKISNPVKVSEQDLNKPKEVQNQAPDDNPKEADTSADTAESKRLSNYPANTSDSLNNDGTVKEKSATPSSSASLSSSSKPNKRQYNPLSKFSSVTYRISLYGITPDAYNSYYEQGKWITKDLELIVQSAGASTTDVRNKYFSLDYFIDDLEITTLTNAKETQTAGNQSDFKFKIYEPYAMSFPSRLVQAEIDIQKQAGIKRPIKEQIEALNCPFLIVIRFYGYDSNGALVTGPVDEGVSYTKTDSSAAFERAFPIVITKFSFKLENKMTVYDVNAKLLNEQIGLGTKRGVVKTGFTITADTVENAIGGNGSGLLDKINSQQSDVTNKQEKEKKQGVADVYKVVFQPDSGIGEALLVDKDSYVKNFAPMSPVGKEGSTVRDSQGANATTVKKSNRTIKIAEGTPILTAIDQIITQSTYLRDAMKVFDKEETQKVQEEDSSLDENAEPKPLYWYNVRTQAKILDFDEIRNDYAYEITYMIQRYQVPYVKSLVTGKSSPYYGPHKIYKYWYSGQNTEILNYEMQYNLLYYLTSALSSESGTDKAGKSSVANSPAPGQGADPTGKLPGKSELQNSVKTFLYSPGDQLKAQIKILGDPDYLMPSESGSTEGAFKQWYGEDYSINPSSGQVFIEIGFGQVEDYDNSTGLLKPDNNIKFWDYPPEIEKITQGRMVYMVTKVVSKFTKGLFSQDIKTILPNFDETKESAKTGTREPEPAKESARTTEAQSANQTDAETARLKRQNDAQPVEQSKPSLPNVMARPSWSPMQGNVWDKEYGKQYNTDGTPKAGAGALAVEGREEPTTNKQSLLSRIFGSGQNAGRGRGSQGR